MVRRLWCERRHAAARCGCAAEEGCAREMETSLHCSLSARRGDHRRSDGRTPPPPFSLYDHPGAHSSAPSSLTPPYHCSRLTCCGGRGGYTYTHVRALITDVTPRGSPATDLLCGQAAVRAIGSRAPLLPARPAPAAKAPPLRWAHAQNITRLPLLPCQKRYAHAFAYNARVRVYRSSSSSLPSLGFPFLTLPPARAPCCCCGCPPLFMSALLHIFLDPANAF